MPPDRSAAQPLISIVMPCFNAGVMLAPALRSAFEQTYSNLEIVFVDNNSTDGSAAAAQSLLSKSSRPYRITTCATQGVNAARNTGYALATGSYIQWLDADDELHPDKIALQVEALEAEPKFDISFCDWLTRRHDPSPSEKRNVLKLSSDDHLTRILSGIWYPPHCFLLRRSAADRLQSMQAWWPTRRVCTDIEYFALAALVGMQFVYVANAVVAYNVWSQTQMGSAIGMALRAASMRDIYARLISLAGKPANTKPLTADQRTLLWQDWNIWAMPAGSVAIAPGAGREFQLRMRDSDRILKVRPRDAAIARLMQQASGPMPLHHHALEIARRNPELRGHHVKIVATLDRFRRAGLLELVQRIDPEPDEKKTA